jgi:hypothetical protein
VVLCAYPTGVKIRTLLQKGRTRASCLNFGSNSTLLCGAKGSGRLLVWDVTQASQAEELNVHMVSALLLLDVHATAGMEACACK